MWSLPVREVWIEIVRTDIQDLRRMMSLPVREVWIEITIFLSSRV